MANEPAKTPIQNKYAQQYADDLAANRKEQSDVTAQIAGLQERLQQLKAEETWLARAQDSLPGATAEQAHTSAPAEEVPDAPQTVPPQRQDQSVKAEQPQQPAKRTAGAKKAASVKKATAKKVAEKATARATTKKATAKPVKKAAAKKASAEEVSAQQAAAAQAPAEEKSGPPLWQLLLDILRKTPGQPCVAREVYDQLAQDHPSRTTSVQTVRNNLETLVKKSLAEKSRQQGSVMYTAYAGAEAAAAPAADGEVEQAPDDAAEKVPAEV